MEQEADRKGIDASSLMREVKSHYQDQETIVRGVKNLYEDAFAYYLSALVYELNQEYNDAFIDLKKFNKPQPRVPFVQNDLLRMARLSGLMDSYKQFSKSFGKKARFINQSEEGEIFLFYECGMAPRKTQIRISLPISKIGLVNFAFPKYLSVPSRIERIAIYDNKGDSCGRTYVLTDLEAIAIRNLQDRMPTLIIKQVLRAAAKGALASTAKEQGGLAGALVANIYNVVTEQADLRSWLTLPKNIQVARIPVPSGDYSFVLGLEDASGRTLQKRPFDVNVQPGKKVFLHARSGTKGLIHFHVF